jgi:hypothetical protein
MAGALAAALQKRKKKVSGSGKLLHADEDLKIVLTCDR